jgi:tetratricopeptide (TPR) repeat protein
MLDKTSVPTRRWASVCVFLAALLASTGAAAQDATKVDVRPHSVASITDKAMSAAEALRNGNYQSAEMLAHEVLTHSRMQSFSFYPLSRFIDHLSQGDDPKFLDGLNAWISHSPKSALAYLIRANYYKETAWLIRGTDFASRVPEEHMTGFRDYLARAQDDVLHSIALDRKIPWSYYLWVYISAGRGSDQELDDAFRASIARFPTYYPLYQIRLYHLTPKWGGSSEAMYQFVEKYAGKAPSASPLKLLYMQLTAYLLNAAWVECDDLSHQALTACIAQYMNSHVNRGVTDGVQQALGLYKHTDPIQFSNALWPILGEMAGTGGDSTSINSVLQLAADAMGSDIQLIHEPGHNNYVIDDIAARIWSKLGNSDNVDQKFKEALDDIERTSFPSDDEKDAALASVYEDMTWVARNTAQYARVIEYHDAANAAGGINRGGTQYLKCFALYHLNQYQAAVQECTELIDTHRDVATARYYRARAYEGLKNYPAALADFDPIAENGSDDYVRWGAIIEMEHINAMLGNYSTELAIFNKYPLVFADYRPPEDLAIAYNNRCFAYMKLGELKKALDDCNASLRYGRLPDALHKQQQLVKLLSAPKS